jgi:hypothetical protein
MNQTRQRYSDPTRLVERSFKQPAPALEPPAMATEDRVVAPDPDTIENRLKLDIKSLTMAPQSEEAIPVEVAVKSSPESTSVVVGGTSVHGITDKNRLGVESKKYDASL